MGQKGLIELLLNGILWNYLLTRIQLGELQNAKCIHKQWPIYMSSNLVLALYRYLPKWSSYFI